MHLSRLSIYRDEDSKGRHHQVLAVARTKAATPSFDLRVDHGTHVSALIGAHGELGQMIGVHPDSQILGVRAEDFPAAVSELTSLHVYSLSLGEKELVAGQRESPFRGWLDLMRRYWLMLDPEHQDMINGGLRSTLWEIHPITKIEVWNNGQWVDLDNQQ